MASACQTFHVLPLPGGLFDQDPLHLYMIQAVLAAQAEKAELESRKNATQFT